MADRHTDENISGWSYSRAMQPSNRPLILWNQTRPGLPWHCLSASSSFLGLSLHFLFTPLLHPQPCPQNCFSSGPKSRSSYNHPMFCLGAPSIQGLKMFLLLHRHRHHQKQQHNYLFCASWATTLYLILTTTEEVRAVIIPLPLTN